MSDDVCQGFCFNPQVVARLKEQVGVVGRSADIFTALADPARTKIIYALSQEELCVCDIASILDASVSSVSHHLRILRTMSLVKYRKEGKMVFYSLDDAHVYNLIGEALEHQKERVAGEMYTT